MSDVADNSLDTILAKLREVVPAIRAEGVNYLAVFGSRARGDARPDSDLDVLVDVDPDFNFGWKNLTGVMGICTDSTGIPTQVAMRSELKPRFAERIADDLIQVF